jgi:hypothetical protein
MADEVTMNATPYLPASILAAVAAVLLLTGYRVRRGDVWLVAGYRPDRVPDPAGLALTVGRTVLMLGVAVAVAAVAALPGVPATSVAVGAAVVVGVAGVVLLVHEARRSLR